jgi:gliding motility-associated-like protein
MTFPSGIAITACLLIPAGIMAQVPTKCLEIESILVDACISATDCPSSTEGMNEMVRFVTGPAPIALADLQFTFYSSSFQGIAQNATTAALTAQLNATVQGCGLLLEPPGGVIPPGSRVIFITSTSMCVQANSFAALNDTLFVIFQVPGNSQGHFKNNDLVGQAITTTPGPPMLRWLRVNVAGTGCGDTATYDAGQLTNIYGTYGGTSAENDGATVEFSWPGMPVPTYLNHGCMAAIDPTLPVVVSGGGPLACGAVAGLVGAVSGSYVSVHWQGGSGSFSDPDSLATNYTPGAADLGTVQLSFCAITACGDSTCTTVDVMVQAPAVSVTASALQGCAPWCIMVAASSGSAATYAWSFGDGAANGDSIAEHCYTVPGIYPVSVTADFGNGCTTIAALSDSVRVQALPTAAFDWSPTSPAMDNPHVLFHDQSSGATSWTWLFGDPAGTVSSQQSPVFTYPGEGCYPVLLVVANDVGCLDSASVQLCIQGADTLVIPNIFSPNNDGSNEVFQVGGNLLSLDLRIYNRWGQLEAWLEHPYQVWDGRSPVGEACSPGTYFYTMHAVSNTGEVIDRSGTITLVR